MVKKGSKGAQQNRSPPTKGRRSKDDGANLDEVEEINPSKKSRKRTQDLTESQCDDLVDADDVVYKTGDSTAAEAQTDEEADVEQVTLQRAKKTIESRDDNEVELVEHRQETTEVEAYPEQTETVDKQRRRLPKAFKKVDELDESAEEKDTAANVKKSSKTKVKKNVEYWEEKVTKTRKSSPASGRVKTSAAMSPDRFRKKEGLKGERLQQWLNRMSTPKHITSKKTLTKRTNAAFGGCNSRSATNEDFFPS